MYCFLIFTMSIIFVIRQVHHQLFLKFDKGIAKLRDYIINTKKHVYLVGVLQASKVGKSFNIKKKSCWTIREFLSIL